MKAYGGLVVVMAAATCWSLLWAALLLRYNDKIITYVTLPSPAEALPLCPGSPHRTCSINLLTFPYPPVSPAIRQLLDPR